MACPPAKIEYKAIDEQNPQATRMAWQSLLASLDLLQSLQAGFAKERERWLVQAAHYFDVSSTSPLIRDLVMLSTNQHQQGAIVDQHQHLFQLWWGLTDSDDILPHISAGGEGEKRAQKWCQKMKHIIIWRTILVVGTLSLLTLLWGPITVPMIC